MPGDLPNHYLHSADVQVARLHRQVAQHVQLLLTSFAAAGKLPGGEPLVASVGQLIHTIQVLLSSIQY